MKHFNYGCAYLEPRQTPIHELDCLLRLDSSHGSLRIFGCNVPAVKHAARHVFSLSRIAFNHLVAGLET